MTTEPKSKVVAMPKRALMIVASTALLGLTACAPQMQWVKPYGDPSSFGRDKYTCQQQAMRAAPPAHADLNADRYGYGHTRTRERCYETRRGDIVCDRRESYYPDNQAPFIVDMNERARDEMFQGCMQSLGWKLVPVQQPR